jgi:RNase H-like domain found in reverse transcriptase
MKELTPSRSLLYPNPKLQFFLGTEASALAYSAALYQETKFVKKPVAFHSGKFSAAELSYTVYKREFLAFI